MKLMQGMGMWMVKAIFVFVRKLLISDYNELRARQNEQHEGDEGGEKEDPIILKLQLA